MSFCVDGVEIGYYFVQLGFNFVVGKEIDFFIWEVNGCFYVDVQVSECFYKMIYLCGECFLQ